jgi:hypothetical protein
MGIGFSGFADMGNRVFVCVFVFLCFSWFRGFVVSWFCRFVVSGGSLWASRADMGNKDFQTWVSVLRHLQTWATGLRHMQTWATGLQNASVGVRERLRFRCACAVCGLPPVRCPR